jgi:nucleoside-diphosphate-sugar epimerase
VEGRPFEVWEGAQLRDFTYVDDAVDALLLAALSDQSNGRTWNLGGDCVISLRGLAGLLVEINGGGEFSVRSYPAKRKRIDIGDYYSDFSRIREALGWSRGRVLQGGAGARSLITARTWGAICDGAFLNRSQGQYLAQRRRS